MRQIMRQVTKESHPDIALWPHTELIRWQGIARAGSVVARLYSHEWAEELARELSKIELDGEGGVWEVRRNRGALAARGR